MSISSRLFDEEWYAIGSLLLESSPASKNTLFSLIRVNKRFHDIFLPLVYRHCTFEIDDIDAGRHLGAGKANVTQRSRIPRFLERDPNDLIFRATRSLTICSARRRRRGPPQTMEGPNWTPLVQFIKHLTRLETLIFDCAESVPIALLAVLEEFHPASHLHVRNWVRKSLDVRVGDPEEEALARSPCLRSIGGIFSGISGGLPINDPAFHRIVTLAPNITSVSFKVCNSDDRSPYLRQRDIDDEEETRSVRGWKWNVSVPKRF
ncbi:hypothetical protein PM082_006346 [Marasmius tenuissimus]|nr:hypothetical protein PM082_006346 [Marasmius tenuissimus]